MMTKFYPLWQIDAVGMEQRLDKLAAKGLQLKGISPLTGIFSFESSSPSERKYRIGYSKGCGGTAPAGIIKAGWEQVCGKGSVYIVSCDKDRPENAPSYKSWNTINRIVMWPLIFIICIMGGFCLGYLSAMLEDTSVFQADPMVTAAMVIMLLLILFLIPVIKGNRRLSKMNVDLKLQGKVLKTIPKGNFIYTKEQEKQMLREGRMKKKFILGWFYTPDTAEKIVAEMALKGWRFYRFNEVGTVFYFEKTEPCKMKFVVDYQNEAGDDYFMQSKEDGWKLEFTSVTRTMSFIIWSKIYEGAEPEFYTDHEFKIKHAKRMALTFGLTYGFSGISLLILSIILLIKNTELIYCVPVYALASAELIFFSAKTVGYYIRTRQSGK